MLNFKKEQKRLAGKRKSRNFCRGKECMKEGRVESDKRKDERAVGRKDRKKQDGEMLS